MANSTLQRLLDAGVQFGEMSRKQAESVVRQLVKAGEVPRRDTEKLVADLVDRGKETSDRLGEVIQREVSKQVSWMSERFDDLEARFEDLSQTLADRVGESKQGADAAPSKTQAAPAKKSTAKKSTAKKSTAKKSTAKKQRATAKQATAKKKRATTETSTQAVGSSGVRKVATKRTAR